MPELPEVETVRRGLEQAIKGAKIKIVTLRRGNLRTPFPEHFAETLTGLTIKSIGRRAKYLLFTFDYDDVLIAHLGMSGRFFVLDKAPAKFTAHDHVVFEFTDKRVLIFNDARRFGLMALAKKKGVMQHPLLASLGPEPLDKTFSPGYLKSALAKRSGPIKTVLMDQAVVVGVGNIYASEALFDAKISPKLSASKATTKAPLLIASIRKVLNAAIKSGGSSLRDFLHVTGFSGDFQHRFNVYGREGKPCFRCGTAIKNMRQAGRSTYFCPQCQR